ncbi:hypothetical protein [Terriglobus sp. TAA 43]|uniref:hypothetical protein n=1 Tax=Terriglobus sp. TAA 43 TaxID=278961 RepID=UPI0006470394|nr:hypothetical protein [Terriglobus sp. TAA 43]
MAESLTTDLLTPEEATQQAQAATAPNGLQYATLGRLDLPSLTVEQIARLVGTVPTGLSNGLSTFQYVFVPLALSGSRLEGGDTPAFPLVDRTLIAPTYSVALADRAICHRNAQVNGKEVVFLSSRLHSDRFALAFEFFINIAHNFTDTIGVPPTFSELLWKQATANVRGETSIDAWEDRAAALGVSVAELDARARGSAPRGTVDEKARTNYYAAAFADSLAIYLLSVFMDFDYSDLREREYPLLAAPALAERLRTISKLFPPNDGYQFQILYRRRG